MISQEIWCSFSILFRILKFMTQILFRMFVTPTPEGNVSGNANKGNKFLFVSESSLQAQKYLICPYLSHFSKFGGQTSTTDHISEKKGNVGTFHSRPAPTGRSWFHSSNNFALFLRVELSADNYPLLEKMFIFANFLPKSEFSANTCTQHNLRDV